MAERNARNNGLARRDTTETPLAEWAVWLRFVTLVLATALVVVVALVALHALLVHLHQGAGGGAVTPGAMWLLSGGR